MNDHYAKGDVGNGFMRVTHKIAVVIFHNPIARNANEHHQDHERDHGQSTCWVVAQVAAKTKRALASYKHFDVMPSVGGAFDELGKSSIPSAHHAPNKSE